MQRFEYSNEKLLVAFELVPVLVGTAQTNSTRMSWVIDVPGEEEIFQKVSFNSYIITSKPPSAM
eukprot:scaffold1749_cov148-Skeletonema_menzelii.AAC.15